MINVILKQERNKLGLSQKQLGDKAGISFVTINRIEAGHPARLSILEKLFTTMGKRLVYTVEDITVTGVVTASESNVPINQPAEESVPGAW